MKVKNLTTGMIKQVAMKASSMASHKSCCDEETSRAKEKEEDHVVNLMS